MSSTLTFTKPSTRAPRAAGLAFAALAFSAVAAFAQAAPPAAETTAPRVISVIGRGAVERAPDMASVSIGVTTTGQTAAEALGANSTALAAVIERLKADGVTGSDLRTEGLSVNPNWTNPVNSDGSASAPRIDGYTAGNTLRVHIRDLTQLGKVLDAAVSGGANTLHSVEFATANPGPLLNEARQAAVADARATAELLAEAAGVTLGPVLSIQEPSVESYQPMPMMRAMAADAGVPIEQGTVSTRASVSIVWAIAP